MATAGTKLIRWVVVVGVAALAGGGIWYAHGRGWLEPASAWVRHLASKDKGAEQNGEEEMEDMPGMPGMKMPKRKGQPDMKSDVPGYSKVAISRELQQRIGVRFGRVEKAPLRMSVRTVGIVRPDETKVARIHIKTAGWAEKLFANYTGQKVRKGDPLLAIYSPDFLNTQEDYLSARKSGSPREIEATRKRLELWDVPAEVFEKLNKTGKAEKDLTLQSPLTGTVLDLNVREKSYITPEKELYVLADLSTVWVQAKVYEYELPHVELGQPAKVTFPALPEQVFKGKVVFIEPTVEEKTRTVQVRVELDNKDDLFKPGMFADVEIQHTMGDGLLVPTSAVIRTGEHDIAFRVDQDDQFVPVIVKISQWKFGDSFQILEGLKAGDRVVTSANFLIDSESRLRFGGGGMPGMPGMDMGDMKGMDHDKMKH
jgi:Cu(I)/Ag(I) efflux system membrane fusion protein